MPSFYVGVRNPNSGPHAYRASVLPTKLSLLSLWAFSRTDKVIAVRTKHQGMLGSLQHWARKLVTGYNFEASQTQVQQKGASKISMRYCRYSAPPDRGRQVERHSPPGRMQKEGLAVSHSVSSQPDQQKQESTHNMICAAAQKPWLL